MKVRVKHLSLLVLSLSAVVVLGQDVPQRLPVDVKAIDASLESEWFGVYLQGKKIGYINSKRTKEGTGDAAYYRETLNMSLKLLSFGQKAEIKVTQVMEFDGKSPFALRYASTHEDDGNIKHETTVKRSDKGFEHVYITGKRKTIKTLDQIDYTLADAMTSETWLKKGVKPGDRITTRGFEAKDLEFPLSAHKVIAEKSSLVSGVKVEFFEIETTLSKPKVSFLARYDKNGHMLSGNLVIFELRRETEEQAKNTEYSQDVFVLGQVKLEKGIGNPARLSSLVLEVKGADRTSLTTGPRQLVTANDNGTLLLKLGKSHKQEVKASQKDIEESLKETRAYPITDAKIKELAARAVGTAETPEEKVKNLVRFTHDFIRPSLSVHIPTIPDLLENKKGDCKSYALLFVTLARAAGIPAREVSGLAYMGDDTKAFGGHAWNEVVLNGVWVPVDAAFNQFEVDAGHVCFGSEEAVGNLLKNLGKLKFRLVEVSK